MDKMIVLVDTPEEKKRVLRQVYSGEVIFKKEQDLDPEDWAQAKILFGNPDPKKILENPQIEWLQLPTAGYDPYEAAGLLDGRMDVTNSVGAYGHAVSEHMLAMLMMFLKKLPIYYDQQKHGIWKEAGAIRSVSSLKTLVYGYGDLGQAFAKRLHALGAEVYGARRSAVQKPLELAGIFHPDELGDKLGEMDLVAFFLPSNPDTQNMVNQAWISQLKEGTILLNGGRGDLIVPEDCIEALEKGKLAGLLLDVAPGEPLEPHDPLWQAPNCYITPHVAGWFNMQETVDNVFKIAVDNIRRREAGKTLHNLIAEKKQGSDAP